MSKNSMTTKRHFKIFQKEALLWVNEFGLNDWTIRFIHEDTPDALASCLSDNDAHRAYIALSPEWDRKPTTKRLKREAFHEVIELLLSKMDYLARERFIDEKEIDIARHAVIASLENLIFGPVYE